MLAGNLGLEQPGNVFQWKKYEPILKSNNLPDVPPHDN
jgi:hypothetical protein